MKHQALDQIQAIAEVGVHYPKMLTRGDRLIRWAECLENTPTRQLFTLHETEHQPAKARDEMRHDESPISIALRDPVLRASGLENDTYGEAKRFFELTDGQLHDILCYCHYGETLSAERAARNVRATITPGVFARIRESFLS